MLYRLSQEAQRDLDDSFPYWAKRASLPVAGRLIDAITDRFWFLADRKARGRIEILHVFHGARAQKWAFRRPKRR